MDRFDVVHTEQEGAFAFALAIAPETDAPDWDMTDEERAQFMQDVEDWQILYFIARVTCAVSGVEMSSEYLGRCAYASVADFIQSEYYKDMCAATKVAAVKQINALHDAIIQEAKNEF